MKKNIKYNKILFLFIVIIIFNLISTVNIFAENKGDLYFNDNCLTSKEFQHKLDKNNINYNLKNLNNKQNLEELKSIMKQNGKNLYVPIFYINGNIIDTSNIDKYISNPNDFIYKTNDINLKDKDVNENSSNIKTLSLVVLSSLMDGLNPCSISMLLFLLSLLIGIKDSASVRKIGLTYTFGVFTSYFVIGMGLYKVVDILSNVFYFRVGIFIISIIITLFLIYKEIQSIKYKDRIYIDGKSRGKIEELFNSYSEGNGGLLPMYFIGFIVGLILFSRMFHIYIPVINEVASTSIYGAIKYIALYSFIYITPIIVMIFIVSKTKDIMGASFKMYENEIKLSKIKIGLFSIMLIYYIYKLYLIIKFI